MKKYTGRKFALTMIALIACIIGLFAGKITSGDFYLCLTAVLGSYGFSNVMDKKHGGEG